MKSSNVAVSLLAVILAACNAGENSSAGSAAAREAAVHDVGARMDSYVALAKSGDIAGLGDYFDAEAVLWEPELKAAGADIVKLFQDLTKDISIDNLQ